MNETIIKRIKETRIQRRLTQQDLADQLGKTASAISDLERGKVQVSASDLYQLAKYLNKPVEYFYGEDYISEDIEDLISIIRRMDPEIRSLQIPLIKSIILLQQKADEINSHEYDDSYLKSQAMEIYDLLIPYLINISDLRSKGFEIKEKLEDVLGITADKNPTVDNS